jgi:hypothetical protein
LLWHYQYMSTLAEIEAAVPRLNADELAELEKFVQAQLRKASIPKAHSVMDIPTVNVGRILRPISSDDDLLGEMLEGRV